jgi:hypothetical protein
MLGLSSLSIRICPMKESTSCSALSIGLERGGQGPELIGRQVQLPTRGLGGLLLESGGDRWAHHSALPPRHC